MEQKSCERCRKENRDNAKFCRFCGAIIRRESFKLEDLVGLEQIKVEIAKITKVIKKQKKLRETGKVLKPIRLHTILVGSTGTGKTKISDVLSRIFFEHGVTQKDSMVVIDTTDHGRLSEKEFDKTFASAKGGILFIDNVQKLISKSNQTSPLDRLYAEMDKTPYDPIIIMAGLKKELQEYLDENRNVQSRFKHIFALNDYSAKELYDMTIQYLAREGFVPDTTGQSKIERMMKYVVKQKDANFANGFFVGKLIDDIKANYMARTSETEDSDCVIREQDIRGDYPEERSAEAILADLDEFVGMANLKERLKKLMDKAKIMKERGGRDKVAFHICLTGNPGTGKTTVVEKLGQIFAAAGILDRGHVVEVDQAKLVSQYVSETPKLVNAKCDEALGGILFIDEAYTLAPDEEGGKNKHGQEAIDALMKRMEADRDKFIVIAAGYDAEMKRFLDANDGLRGRFSEKIALNDYSPDELHQIFLRFVRKGEYILSPAADAKIKNVISDIHSKRDKKFANARESRNLYENVITEMSNRLAKMESTLQVGDVMSTITEDDIKYELPKEMTLEEALGELNEMIGMDNIKASIRELANQVKISKERVEKLGKGRVDVPHVVLTGNPGTGKTTVALTLGKVMKAIGVLPTHKVIETSEKDLVAQYLGQTKKKTAGKVDDAMGGILFIDEAYSLAGDSSETVGGSSYGKEAIEELLLRMENDRGRFMLIVGGYQDNMKKFLETNPGLKSRFDISWHIEDYKPDELHKIYLAFARKDGYEMSEAADVKVAAMMKDLYERRDKDFGNGRDVRKSWNMAKSAQATRLAGMTAQARTAALLALIEAEDIKYEMPKEMTLEDALGGLNGMIGMENIKTEIMRLMKEVRFNKEREEKLGRAYKPALHIVLTGNPGTGKTTVASLLGKVFKAVGILPTEKVIETSEKDLVAQYVGQTKKKTSERINDAMGGILFVDEAYSLAGGSSRMIGGSDFGREAIEELLLRMEKDRGRFILIIAGYGDKMEQFLETNPGLKSRFDRTWHIDDYKPTELCQIFMSMVQKDGYRLTPQAEAKLKKGMEDMYARRDKNFGNGRDVRKLYENVLRAHANRFSDLPPDDRLAEKMSIIDADDLECLL